MLYLIDARGLLCPQPVISAIETMDKIRKDNASVKIGVLIDAGKESSKTNIERAANSLGWQTASITTEEDSKGKYLKIIFEKTK